MLIEWSNLALDDVQDIHDYIRKDSPYYANLFVELIFQTTDRLSDFPKSGRVIPECDHENWREVVVGDYRIMYIIKPENILILAVMHCSRDMTNPKNQPWVIN
jgi:toxin ParE1/3/4